VLVVAGTVDRLLPSYEEAKRLQATLPKCSVHYASEWDWNRRDYRGR
jgi:hypothetical protein